MLLRNKSSRLERNPFSPSLTPGGHMNIALFLRVSLQTITKTNETYLEEKAVLTAIIAISKLGKKQKNGIIADKILLQTAFSKCVLEVRERTELNTSTACRHVYPFNILYLRVPNMLRTLKCFVNLHISDLKVDLHSCIMNIDN